MKKYDKIYVDREGMEEGIFFDSYSTVKVTPREIMPGGDLKEPKWFKQVTGPLIVLTVEELKDVFESAYMAGHHDNGASLEDYLKHKGIQL